MCPTTGTVQLGRVLRPAAIPQQRWLPGHRGVDLALNVGEPVRAAGTGTVAVAGPVVGTPTVSIDHPDGIRTTYQPVYATVSSGETVTAGQVIGRLAPSTTGFPGLQWGAKIGSDGYLDPLTLLPLPVIRLKPLAAAAPARP
ncbi:Peptidase family M23 [Corynebacterium uterequi]|uniref:Peptidase family M23 n=1 Tax=Corynebacterium uterequi TaxID=1072256 RepID=A0A0G3HF45_9CORY|nr:Peptidase family M23 [Corynebacterium uterequi]